MDRVAGTSFFMPSGLVVGGVPLQGVMGGGNPLLWQHLFWFLAHPEVYVLILPAMGIVAEVITVNARRPLWGYGLMVSAVLFMGGMSMVVWAHHMFLSGMGTSLSLFFQVTTMIISIPSVILISSLVMSLWGGSIRFTTPMLFALAFLPMFGIGGLTGLPLGLAASDVTLHDTYYVVAHFHYLVAPGTVFALFAGIYHWFPRITGRLLNERLGKVHFWGSLVCMNLIFMPMFVVGLMGVNRRLYDAGASYALAQPTLMWQTHMTYAAILLGLFQLPFVWNLAVSCTEMVDWGQTPRITISTRGAPKRWIGRPRRLEMVILGSGPNHPIGYQAGYGCLGFGAGQLALVGLVDHVLRLALLRLCHAPRRLARVARAVCDCPVARNRAAARRRRGVRVNPHPLDQRPRPGPGLCRREAAERPCHDPQGPDPFAPRSNSRAGSPWAPFTRCSSLAGQSFPVGWPDRRFTFAKATGDHAASSRMMASGGRRALKPLTATGSSSPSCGSLSSADSMWCNRS